MRDPERQTGRRKGERKQGEGREEREGKREREKRKKGKEPVNLLAFGWMSFSFVSL